MQEALKEAQIARDNQEIPIGTVIVKNNKIIARAHNKKRELNDPTAHAEILAIREATKVLDDWHLEDCEIFITTEPCPMCLGAILQTGIKKIVFGCPEPKLGAVESKLNFYDFPHYNKNVEFISGVMEEECKKILKDFFKNKRL